jgi:acyl-coenzyme A synthetase/AMP-(fatty) acid ligase
VNAGRFSWRPLSFIALAADWAQRWGESPHAFVVLRQPAQATEEGLKRHVRNVIAHFKTPQWINFVDELPKTATGKVAEVCAALR